ncbi:hypothetical protein ACLOJK_006608 [Asimina triloba]
MHSSPLEYSATALATISVIAIPPLTIVQWLIQLAHQSYVAVPPLCQQTTGLISLPGCYKNKKTPYFLSSLQCTQPSVNDLVFKIH